MSEMRLYGFKVMVTPDTPRMQLSEHVLVSDEFRVKTNAWLLDFFGGINLIKDGDTLLNKRDQVIFVNPRMFEKLKTAALK